MQVRCNIAYRQASTHTYAHINIHRHTAYEHTHGHLCTYANIHAHIRFCANMHSRPHSYVWTTATKTQPLLGSARMPSCSTQKELCWNLTTFVKKIKTMSQSSTVITTLKISVEMEYNSYRGTNSKCPHTMLKRLTKQDRGWLCGKKIGGLQLCCVKRPRQRQHYSDRSSVAVDQSRVDRKAT